MHFGVFDHLDWNGGDLTLQYEDRLRMIEALDRAGFHAYHVAEHHGTPSGRAPSPSVFLAAVAQRTRRLRFGPLVYALSMHHPLRVFEEICMLDQMSGGRFELGIGRGISPIENGFYGVDHADAQKIFVEAQEVIMKAFAQRELDYEGEFFTFRDVPIVMAPVQRPHPPLWVGVAKTSSVPWPAANGVNIVATGTNDQVRDIVETYWSKAGHRSGPAPLVGMNRHIMVADTDEEARRVAARCYVHWHDSILHLWRRSGQDAAEPDVPARIRRGRAQWLLHRRDARSRPAAGGGGHCGHGRQLFRLPVRLWRHDPRGIPALGRSLYPRGDAGRRAGACRGLAGASSIIKPGRT